ncbi:MAG: peptidoglycan-binding protein, partial [Clostridia bacterium]|nr:peptidoglycan-binding protein [Clostridia bacterium]
PAQPAETPTPASGGSGGWSDWGTVSGTTPTPQPGVSVSVLPDTTPQSSTIVFDTYSPRPSDGTQTVTAAPRETIQVVTRPPATPTPTPKSLQRGFTGSDEVRAVQKRLKALGYYTGSVDGDFGAGTEAAVKAFQKANGLTADGKVGEKTLAKLNARDAVTKKQASATPTPKPTAKATAKPTARPTKKPTATPRATATPNLTKDYYLQLGASGAKVRTLQNRLIQLGWLGGKATGTYDEATEAAVRAFQKKTKGLWEDGIAGPDTLRALYASGAAKASTAAASTGETLEKGSEGDAVRALQRRLKELGYLSGTVDGSFGIATEAAVIAFQQRNGLTADGKAGSATLNRLYSEDAVKNGGSPVDTSTSRDTSAGRDTSGISSTGYVTLENGSTGAAVRKLQERLKQLGYYSGSVDGSFGDGTEAAVMAFQLRNKLTVDGKAGPATQRALYGSGTAIAYTALRTGEEGTAVRNLQYTLYELGYYTGTIDGEYGQSTADAVRAFQIQNRLSPVDGVAGSATLARLYSADALPAEAAAVSYDTARPGDKGELVVEIQDCLVQMGYLERISGVYDESTEAAVRQFQKESGLTADGVAGGKTLQYLFGY